MASKYSKLDVVDNLSLIEIEKSPLKYSAKALSGVYTEDPRQAGIVGAAVEQQLSDDSIAGLAIYKNKQQLGAVSLVSGKNALWIDSDTLATVQAVLFSMMYGLVLGSWLTE